MARRGNSKKVREDIVFDDSDDEQDLEAFKSNFKGAVGDGRAQIDSEESTSSVEDDDNDDDEEEEEEEDLNEKNQRIARAKDMARKAEKLKGILSSIGSDQDESSDESRDEDGEDEVEDAEEEGSEEEGVERTEETDGSDVDSAEEDTEGNEENAVGMREKVTGPKQHGAKRKLSSSEDVSGVPIPRKLSKGEGVVDDKTRLSIREELRTMSMEEILALKEKLGLKVYNGALGLDVKKDKQQKTRRKEEFKRENKNRPREMSSKKTVSRLRDVVGVSSQQNARDHSSAKRDPRFDATCGDFDHREFRQNYKFVDAIKAKERKQLEKELEYEEEGSERAVQIKYLIQRYDNQQREKGRREEKARIKQEERDNNKRLAGEGRRPKYMSRAEAKNKELVARFGELKKSGNLEKYLKKKNKKNETRDRKKSKM